MKQIVLADIHGRTCWKRIVEKHADADRLIFLGDYVDTHESISPKQQLDNLLDIVEFKKNSSKEVIALLGNHDFHYWPGIMDMCSGYQPTMRQSFQQVFEENKELFQMCFLDENDYIYSHAGITKSWLYFNSDDIITDSKQIVDHVNELFKNTPHVFGYFPGDMSGYGNHVRQSPIWVRPDSLYRDGIKQLQIVGHTTQHKINPLKSARQGYWLIDALGISKEYLVIEDGKINIDKYE